MLQVAASVQEQAKNKVIQNCPRGAYRKANSNFTEKLKTASGKYRINMVAWSFLAFAVNVILNFFIG